MSRRLRKITSLLILLIYHLNFIVYLVNIVFVLICINNNFFSYFRSYTIHANLLTFFVICSNCCIMHIVLFILDSERSDECICFTTMFVFVLIFFFYLCLSSHFRKIKVLRFSSTAYFLIGK